MRRLGREVTGPLRGNSKGGWALGCHKAGRVFVGLGPRSPLRHVPPSCSGGLAPHPLTRLPGAPARHHLGEPPAQRPHSSQEPSAILQACSPPPAPIRDAVLGPPSSSQHGHFPGPSSPPPSGPSPPVLTLGPRACSSHGLTPLGPGQPPPHTQLRFRSACCFTHTHTRALILPWSCSPGPQHSPEALSPHSHTC